MLTWAIVTVIRIPRVDSEYLGWVLIIAMALDTWIILSLSNVALSWIGKAVS